MRPFDVRNSLTNLYVYEVSVCETYVDTARMMPLSLAPWLHQGDVQAASRGGLRFIRTMQSFEAVEG